MDEIQKRLTRLEKQNRRMKIFFFVLIIGGCGFAIYKEIRMHSLIETHELVIKDNHGNKRAHLSVDEESERASLTIFDTNSKPYVSLYVSKPFDEVVNKSGSTFSGSLLLHGGKWYQNELSTQSTFIQSDSISVENGSWKDKTGYTWNIRTGDYPGMSLRRIGQFVGGISLGHDKDKYYISLGETDAVSFATTNGCEMVSGDNPSISLIKDTTKRIVIGSAELVNEKTKDKITTEPTIFIFDNDGNIMFDPRKHVADTK